MPHRGIMGKSQGLSEAGIGGKHQLEPLLWFLQEEIGEAG